MFRKKTKWHLLFHSIEELEELFALRPAVVHRYMFGEVLLVKKGQNYLAFRNRCPHQKKSLEGCKIENGTIVCPYHQYRFSLESGRGHGMYIDKYKIKIEEGSVYLGKETVSLF